MNLRDRVRADSARIFASPFAVPVAFIPCDGPAITVRGIWREGEQLVDAGDYLQVSSAAISVAVRRADLGHRLPVIGEDRVEFEGAAYTVADVQPKHPDLWEIRLHRRQA